LISDKNMTSPSADVLIALRDKIKGLKDGSQYQLPNMLDIVEELKSYQIRNSSEYIDMLTYLGGEVVTVRNGNYGAAVLDCVDELPDDFAETGCLVTDASGSLRGTYEIQEKFRDDLIRLNDGFDSSKTYKNLTVYHDNVSSGKTAYIQSKRKSGTTERFPYVNAYTRELYEAIEESNEVIQSRPKEKFLLICHKETCEEVENKLKLLLGTDFNRVAILTMGNHTAINKYKDIPNCIIMGMTYMNDAQYEALGRASGTYRTKDGAFPKARIRRVREQEFKHNLLQAATRIRIRSAENGDCKESRLWLRASIAGTGRGARHNEPKRVLQEEVFPGCTLKPWHEDAKKKGGTFIDKTLEVFKRYRDEGRTEFSQEELRREVGHQNPRAFGQKVLKPIEIEFYSRLYMKVKRGRENWYERIEIPDLNAA